MGDDALFVYIILMINDKNSKKLLSLKQLTAVHGYVCVCVSACAPRVTMKEHNKTHI